MMRRLVIPVVVGVFIALGGGCEDARESSRSTTETAGGDRESLKIDASKSDKKGLSAHLAFYSQGVIGAEEKLTFQFKHPVVSADVLNKPFEDLVSIQPRHDIVAVFTATDTLEVRHQDRFPAGASFVLTIDPDKLSNVRASLSPFNVKLAVIPQEITVREIGLAVDEVNSERMKLVGMVETTDTTLDGKVEQVLTAEREQDKLPINWKQENRFRHRFTVENIPRGAKESVLNVRWDGRAIEAQGSGEQAVIIPRLDSFEVVSVRPVETDSDHLEVRFSENLNPAQDLKGIARINSKEVQAQIDGNVLKVYGLNEATGEVELSVSAGIASTAGHKLAKDRVFSVLLPSPLPAVRFATTGTILPPADRLTVPIEAVSVHAVRIRAFEIFANNVGFFLQTSGIDDASTQSYYESMHSNVGRYFWEKTVELPSIPNKKWERFDLDLTDLVRNKKGSLLRLELEVLPQFSVYRCSEAPAPKPTESVFMQNFEGITEESPIPEHLQRYYKSVGYYQWEYASNPCNTNYYNSYNSRTLQAQLFLGSNIGLLAKKGGEDKMRVLATDLKTAAPLSGAVVKIFNYQQQLLGSGSTDAAGLVDVPLQGVPYFLTAEHDSDLGYLKVPKNAALPTNQFDTGGVVANNGVKGFFYGERDIWRPGDDIYLTFILVDTLKSLPSDYPVTVEFFDPRGVKVQSVTNSSSVNGFYTYKLSTDEHAPTGNWRVITKIGSQFFDSIIKVENITPNRLKIQTNIPDSGLAKDSLPFSATLKAEWLTGAAANSLTTAVEARLSAAPTSFAGFEAYHFDDKARSFTQEPQSIFQGALNATGEVTFPIDFRVDSPPPGFLNATFTQRVQEPGGQWSTQFRTVMVSPFEKFVGILIPQGSPEYFNALDLESDHQFPIVVLNANGEPGGVRRLKVTVYEIDWQWWWDNQADDLSRYVSDGVHATVQEETVVTDAQGKATWLMKVKDLEWGRHLIRVCDAEKSENDQHCTSKDIYLGWGSGDTAVQDAATRIGLATDKAKYSVGESASIRLPQGADRKVFVSIENGNRVLTSYWQDIASDKNSFSVPISAEMAPNVYVHVTYLQPHEGRNNDLPIRLYGIVPLMVDDPATHLKPVIQVADRVRPEGELDVGIREEQGRAMTFTIAVVDEGLLGITDFHTPNPHKIFYRREALGVLTWDLFDSVVGAYGGELSRILALGGSDSLRKREAPKERRFPPIVKFFGPFELEEGGERHELIELPPYMGEVRIMVVSGAQNSFGVAEKSVKVTQPLTIASTLPRVLGPGEELELPVTLFTSEPPFGLATVRGEGDERITLTKPAATVRVDKVGESTVNLAVRVKESAGVSRVRITAELEAEKAREEIYIPVRNSNTATTVSETRLLAPGEIWNPESAPLGIPGTSHTTLTVSKSPEFKLRERLDYLIEYPHGCVEQITSAAFPQLYLTRLIQLPAEQIRETEINVAGAIRKLSTFQAVEGGFSYWPFQASIAEWSTSYVGHFLLEAKRLGYAVPDEMVGRWRNYQRARVQSKPEMPHTIAEQAYALYTLALANSPDPTAMNRLREIIKLRSERLVLARWMLALAYDRIGMTDVAMQLQREAGVEPENLAQPGYYDSYYYGSVLRDQAVLLLLLSRLGQQKEAWELGERVAKELESGNLFDTHATAWSLSSLAQVFGGVAQENIPVSLKIGEQEWENIALTKPFLSRTIENYSPGSMQLKNDGPASLYVAVAQKGVPAGGQEVELSNGLELAVSYTDIKGAPLDVSSLTQGTDLVATVTVNNISGQMLDNIALTLIMPSGWQIRNSRLEGGSEQADIDYQDIRDDRVISYFPLAATDGFSRSLWDGEANRKINKSVTVKVLLNASFLGRFYLPGWAAEAMYDPSKRGSVKGEWVRVIAP